MRKIMISIALVALMLTGCSQKEGKTTAVENIATDTVATIGDASADATTEEVVEEPAPEKETLEANNAVTTEDLVTTEIGGGKKKEDSVKPSTTETMKPSNSSNSGSGHNSTSSNSGSAISNGSNGNSNSSGNNNSNNSNSGNSGSSNSGNSGSNNSANSGSNNGGNNNSANNGGSNNFGNNTPQHQHNYNVWVKTKDAWDETVVDTPKQTIEHPEEGYWADAVQCRMCGQVFTSMEALDAHADHGAENYGTANDVWVKTKDAWTETIPAKTHTVHHDEEGYWACSCGARK